MTRRTDEVQYNLTMALLNAAVAGLRAHCSDVETHHYWTDDDPQLRKLAQRACTGCPGWVACREAAETLRPTAGVWASKDWTHQPGRARAA